MPFGIVHKVLNKQVLSLCIWGLTRLFYSGRPDTVAGRFAQALRPGHRPDSAMRVQRRARSQ
jgi:hypothetical protein